MTAELQKSNSNQDKLIHSLIPKIMSEVGSIEKTRVAQNYRFRGIDDVYRALQGPLSKYGVYFVPEVIESSREEKASKAGGIITVVILKIRFTFFAPDGSYVSAITIGEAMDSSDKASNKAMSAALKYCLFQVFCIPTEEEKDSEYQNHEPIKRMSGPIAGTNATSGVLTPKQVARLHAIADKNGWDKPAVLDYLGKLGLTKPDELNFMQYDHMCKAMEKFPRNFKKQVTEGTGNASIT